MSPFEILTFFALQFEFIFHWIIGLSGMHALPLAAGRNEGGHYFRYIFLFSLLLLGGTVIQNPRRGCRRVSNFCVGS